MQILGTVANRKLSTDTCVSEPIMVAISCTLKSRRGGIFTVNVSLVSPVT